MSSANRKVTLDMARRHEHIKASMPDMFVKMGILKKAGWSSEILTASAMQRVLALMRAASSYSGSSLPALGMGPNDSSYR